MSETIWAKIGKIQDALSLSDQQLSDLLELKPDELQQTRLKKSDPGLKGVMNFSKTLNLSFDHFMRGEIDYHALIAHFEGNTAHLPEVYTTTPNSKARNVLYLIDYLSKHMGEATASMVLRHFQVPKSSLLNPDREINMKLSVDIAEWVFDQYSSPHILFNLGKNFPIHNANSEIGEKVRGTRTIQEAYEYLIGELAEKYVEKNFKWKFLKISPYGATLEGTPNRDLIATFGEAYMLASSGCMIRDGFISSIPLFLGYSCASTRKSSCVAKGDSSCTFEIDFMPAIRGQERKLSLVN